MWDAVSAISSKSRHFVEFFHSLPHLNMWFAKSNSTFDPNNSDYLETILFWSTVPILLLILILLVLILYACCLVCSSGRNGSNANSLSSNYSSSHNIIKINEHSSSSFKRTRRHIKQFKFLIGFFILLLSISLGLLIFGSETFHYSFLNVTANIKEFSSYFRQVGNQTKRVKEMIQTQINATNEISKYIKDCQASNFKQCVSDYKSQNQMNKLAMESIKELTSIRQSLNESFNSLAIFQQIESERSIYMDLIEHVEMGEKTRWLVMIGVISINMLLVFLLLIGLIKDSKGSLCFFAFAGVLSLISIWVLNALYMGIAVFLADYCMLPDQYIMNTVSSGSNQNFVWSNGNNNQLKSLVNYYTTCSTYQPFNNQQLPQSKNSLFQGSKPSNNLNGPFKMELNRAESKLRTANTLYGDNFLTMSHSIVNEKQLKRYNFQESIINIETVLDQIRTMIKCDQTSMSYRRAVQNLCQPSMLGLTCILLASITFGLIMPILICIIPQMWRRMHRKEFYDYHFNHHRGSSGSNSNNLPNGIANADTETHPFISSSSNNGMHGHIRTNISAARQFNESPSFQRLNTTTAATTAANATATATTPGAVATLGRNGRYSTMNKNANQNNVNNYASTTLSYNQTKLNRINEFVVNTDPYLMLNNNTNNNNQQQSNNSNLMSSLLVQPSAPPSQLNAYQSYYTQISTMGRERFQ